MNIRSYFVDGATKGVRPELMDAFDDTFDGDEWGNAIGWAFAVAHILFHYGEVPESWDYQHGLCDENMVNPEYLEESEITYLMADCGVTTDDLIAFGDLLENLLVTLTAQGKDY